MTCRQHNLLYYTHIIENIIQLIIVNNCLQISEHLNVGIVSLIFLSSHVIGLILLPNFAPAYFTNFWNYIPTHRALLLGYGLVSVAIICILPILMKK